MANKCVLHYDSIDTSRDLVTMKELETWKTIINAAEVRHYAPIIELSSTLKESVMILKGDLFQEQEKQPDDKSKVCPGIY